MESANQFATKICINRHFLDHRLYYDIRYRSSRRDQFSERSARSVVVVHMERN